MSKSHYPYAYFPLRQILKNDDINEFIANYKTKQDILDKIYVRPCSHEDRKKCKHDSINYVIIRDSLIKGNSKIVQYIIKKFGLNLEDMLFLLTKFKQTNNNQFKNEIRKLILNSLLYSKFDSEENAIILEKMFIIKDWIFIDLFHGLGVKINNINVYVNNLPFDKLQKILDLGYKFNITSILNLISKYGIYDSSSLAKLGFSQKMIVSPNNKDLITQLYKIGNLELIKFIEHNEFVVTEECLRVAVSGYNFEVILNLVNDKKFKLIDDDIYKLFFVTKKKNQKNKKFRCLSYRYRNLCQRIKFRNGIKIRNILNYEKMMIKIIDNCNLSDKTLRKIFDKSVNILLYGYCFDLIIHICKKFNYDVKFYINKQTIEELVLSIIIKDNVDILKKLFASKIVVPIDISVNCGYVDYAILYNSPNMINYFSNDLKMVCSSNVYNFNQYASKDVSAIINNLIKLDYPINNQIIRKLVRSCKFNIILDLINKGYDMPSFVIDYAILCKKYNIATKLLENGVTIKKRNYIDKIIKLGNNRNIFNRFSYNFSNVHPINTKSQIDYMLSLGCSSSDSNIINCLAESGAFESTKYMHMTFGYLPDVKHILSFFLKYRWSVDALANKIIDYLNYIKNDVGINIFAKPEFDDFNFNMFCESLASYSNRKSQDSNEAISLLKYFVNGGNITLTLEHLKSILLFSYQCSFDNIFDFFKEHDVVPTKDFLIFSIQNRSTDLTKFLVKMYKFELTLKDIHNFIGQGQAGFNIEAIIVTVDLLGIETTPYTNKLMIDRYLGDYYYSNYLQTFIMINKKLIHESYIKIMETDQEKLKKFIEHNDIEIVEYEPDIDEIPDVLPVPINDDFDDDFTSDESKDYVDEILDKYKV